MDPHKTYVAVSSSPRDEYPPFGHQGGPGIQQCNDKSRSNWKPTVLRTFSLLSIFIVTVFLIGCLQWALKVLPNRNVSIRQSYVESKAGISGVLNARQAHNTIDDVPTIKPFGPRRHVPRHGIVRMRDPQATPAPGDMPTTASTTMAAVETTTLSTTSTSRPGTNFAPDTSLIPDNPTSIASIGGQPSPLVGSVNNGGNPEVNTGGANLTPGNAGGSGSGTSSGNVNANSNGGSSNAGNAGNSNVAAGSPASPPTTSVYTTSVPGQGLVVVTRTFAPTAAPSRTAQSSGATSTGTSDFTYSIETYGMPVPWTRKEAFISTYLPVIIAVFYRLLWATLLEKLSLVDPFRQLAKKGGAAASDAFFQWYHRPLTILAPFKAFHGKRWTLFVAVLTNLAAGAIPALASESITVDTRWNCPAELQTGFPGNPCPPVMVATVVTTRALQGVLALTAAALIIIMISLWRTGTGLTHDPSSIIGVAQLMGDSELAELLHQLPANGMHTSSSRQVFGERRYELATWQHANGASLTGVVPVDMHEYAHGLPRNEGMHEGRKSSESTARAPSYQFEIYGLLILVTGALGTILAYHLDGSQSSFNNFFNSNGFGPRFILTLSGTIIVTLWQSIEQDTTVMAPYKRLYSASDYGTHSDLTFRPTITPFHSSYVTFTHRYYFPLQISLVVLLGQALNIVISGVPYAPGVTLSQYTTSRYMSMAILALMLGSGVMVAVHRYKQRKIPVWPFTLGAKMSTLVGSRVVDHALSSGSYSGAGVLHDKRYCLRSVHAGHGGQRWVVDEVTQG